MLYRDMHSVHVKGNTVSWSHKYHEPFLVRARQYCNVLSAYTFMTNVFFRLVDDLFVTYMTGSNLLQTKGDGFHFDSRIHEQEFYRDHYVVIRTEQGLVQGDFPTEPSLDSCSVIPRRPSYGYF